MGLRKQTALRVAPLEDRSLPSAAFVLDWNDLVVDVQRVRGQGNQAAARALAMVGAAVYDSVNAVHPTHTVYHVDARAFPDVAIASPDAAGAQAAHDVAHALYTQPAERARFDGLLAAHLDEVPDGPAEAAGIRLGQFVAGEVLAWRANDHSGDTVPYTPGTGPGVWQPTPRPNPNPPPAELPGLPAATPQWPLVTPFAMTSGDQFRPGPPPALASAAYTEAYRQVRDIGRIDSATRTPEQTEIALYWANAGVGLWNQITHTVAVAHDLSLAENARLFAQVNVANADAFIASYDTKYTYNFWRPVTAIRAADTDGNPDTIADPAWRPLIPTPNHPSYASNHSIQCRAAAEALAAFFGTDHVGFSATSVGIERSYRTFTEAAKEGGRSRVFAGIHWSFDVAIGEKIGRKVGQYVADHYFRPLTGWGGEALRAAAAAAKPAYQSLSAQAVRPLLTEALARWQRAGVDTSALSGLDVHVADLGGRTLGRAADGTIWLDDNAAGWRWFVDRTPRSDAEFTRAGNQGEQNRMDLLTVLEHEVGHLLGYGHESAGVMQDTLAAGTRRAVGPAHTAAVFVPGVDLTGVMSDEGAALT